MCPKNESAVFAWRGWLVRNERWIAGVLLLLAVTVRLFALTRLPAVWPEYVFVKITGSSAWDRSGGGVLAPCPAVQGNYVVCRPVM